MPKYIELKNNNLLNSKPELFFILQLHAIYDVHNFHDCTLEDRPTSKQTHQNDVAYTERL